ncbi:hypothetical protein DFS33DRAFT_833852 [Desarmillaria ectypa]|nr:hypothetical protein DFS33DRAFT_833852 [Desarmillaria ectypa]
MTSSGHSRLTTEMLLRSSSSCLVILLYPPLLMQTKTHQSSISGVVQIYFAHHISALSGSRIIGLIIAVLAVTQGTLSIVAGAQTRTVGDVSHLQERNNFGTTILLAGSTLCDVIIVVSMSYFLPRLDSKYKETKAVISKFIRLTIETGTMTATVAVIDLILFLVFPHKNFHITALVLAKLYSNTSLSCSIVVCMFLEQEATQLLPNVLSSQH